MRIEVFVRNVFGSPLIYPSCDLAKQFATFASCRTFSPVQIEQLRAMGVQVDRVPDPQQIPGVSL